MSAHATAQPESETAHVASAGRIEEQTTADPQIIRADDGERKREATAIALLAIHRGHVVHRLRGGEFIVEWRGCMKHCRDLAELEQHARRVGAMR